MSDGYEEGYGSDGGESGAYGEGYSQSDEDEENYYNDSYERKVNRFIQLRQAEAITDIMTNPRDYGDYAFEMAEALADYLSITSQPIPEISRDTVLCTKPF